MKTAANLFQTLYEADHQWVCHMLTRIAGPEEAQDLSQIVFAKAASALSSFRGDAQTPTWHYSIAAHVASDWLRSRPAKEAKVTVGLSDAFDHDASVAKLSWSSQDDQASPEQDLIRKQMCECIRGVIGQLPEKQRTVRDALS